MLRCLASMWCGASNNHDCVVFHVFAYHQAENGGVCIPRSGINPFLTFEVYGAILSGIWSIACTSTQIWNYFNLNHFFNHWLKVTSELKFRENTALVKDSRHLTWLALFYITGLEGGIWSIFMAFFQITKLNVQLCLWKFSKTINTH